VHEKSRIELAWLQSGTAYQSTKSASPQRMNARDSTPRFDPAPSFLFLGLGRRVNCAIGRQFCSLLCGNVAFMYIPVSHISSCTSIG
jgi:hypothetical protein